MSKSIMESDKKFKISLFSNKGIAIDFDSHSKYIENLGYLKKRIIELELLGLEECLISYHSISLYFKKLNAGIYAEIYEKLYSLIFNIDIQSVSNLPYKTFEIPVVYNGPDLEFVAEHCQLSIEQIISLHTQPLYQVVMIGFLPGFPYLKGLDEKLNVPRKQMPRAKVPKGSLGLAGNQTGIYPWESPGGWQLIGTTEFELFTLKNNILNTIQAGDFIKFIPL
jgi:inhibitor of KinA